MEEDDKIYDEVSEAQYKSIVAGRLAQDDFVEDDGFSGYVDTGVDDFEKAEESEQSEDDRPKGKCAFFTFLILEITSCPESVLHRWWLLLGRGHSTPKCHRAYYSEGPEYEICASNHSSVQGVLRMWRNDTPRFMMPESTTPS